MARSTFRPTWNVTGHVALPQRANYTIIPIFGPPILGPNMGVTTHPCWNVSSILTTISKNKHYKSTINTAPAYPRLLWASWSSVTQLKTLFRYFTLMFFTISVFKHSLDSRELSTLWAISKTLVYVVRIISLALISQTSRVLSQCYQRLFFNTCMLCPAHH